MKTPSHTPPTRSPKKIASSFGALLLIFSSLITAFGAGVASADAPHGVGYSNVTTNGFGHPWMGSWATDIGPAYCIDSGSWDPRATGNVTQGDTPAIRGVSDQNRNALSFALWKYGSTSDPLTGAGMGVVAHGLSGDSYASTNVPSMTVSDGNVYNKAVAIYNDAQAHANYVGSPTHHWQISQTFSYQGGNGWFLKTKVTNYYGTVNIAGVAVTITPGNANEGPGVGVTNANGEINTSLHQSNLSQPITSTATTSGPGYYSVFQGPGYAEGPAAQQIIRGNSVPYSGSGRATIPSGTAAVRKTTTNPSYQDAVGATFQVQPNGGGASLGTLTVGADGNTNGLTLNAGTYQLVEKTAPAGVMVDPTPHVFTLSGGQRLSIPLTDEVQRNAELNLLKVDEKTGQPVAGAVVNVKKDQDNDGTYELDKGTFTLSASGQNVPGLSAGKYMVTEVSPPPGYLPPKVASQYVTLAWNETATVTFEDHLVPSITTTAQIADSAGDPQVSVEDAESLAAMANTVGVVGSSLHDVATVNGLAADEEATITTNLYGPFMPGSSFGRDGNVCTPDTLVWSGTKTITGSGEHTSDSFTPTRVGLYAYVETLDVPGTGSYTGRCGEITETSIFTPTITTKAQAPKVTPGAAVTDLATVTGLAPGQTGDITTSLYGPFNNTQAMTDACKTNMLGTPVGTVQDQVVGTDAASFDQASSSMNLPTENYAGVYTFIETLTTPGFPPITHECGTPPETFTVPPTPTISTVAQADGAKAGSNVTDKATITGLQSGVEATIETSLYGPFKDTSALANACKADSLGKPVGAVTDNVTGTDKDSIVQESSPIKLPDDAAGVYTFIETLKVPGYPPITHECGTPPETFTVAEKSAGGGNTTAGAAALPVTGAKVLGLGGLGLVIVAVGGVLVIGSKRRRVNEA